jgi:hypothetical protein
MLSLTDATNFLELNHFMKKLLTAAIAAITCALPVSAKVDPGTIELIRTMEQYGVTVQYNPITCDGSFAGLYSTRKNLTLCYGSQPTANDFDTVRHEAFHFLQHCASQRRGQLRMYPLAANAGKRMQWIQSVLTPRQIDEIKEAYPPYAHHVELEAFASAKRYSASEITSYIKTWCRKP